MNLLLLQGQEASVPWAFTASAGAALEEGHHPTLVTEWGKVTVV